MVNLRKVTVGVLSVHGKDSMDFLQRLSTNQVTGIAEGGVINTVFTTEKAKIVEMVSLVNKGDHILSVSGSPDVRRVKEWLEKYIILEDVQIFDVTNEYSMIKLLGSESISYITNCLKLGPLKEGETISNQFHGCGGLLFRDPLWNEPVFNLVYITECEESILYGLQSRSTGDCALRFIEHPEYERIRIEHGVPASGREISEHVNPLEAGLEKFVSFTKGCYIGQEVIARLDTYQKLQKHLRGFLFTTTDMEKLPCGTVYQNGAEVGWTTSHAFSPNRNAGIALGFLKTSVTSSRIEFVPAGSQEIFSGTVEELPFIRS